MSRTAAHEKKNKYAKSSFSREKTFANSIEDIVKNERKMNDFRAKRSAERDANIKTASGFTPNNSKSAEESDERNARKIISSKFYFEKMNFMIYNLPAKVDINMVLREFAEMGKIQYITYCIKLEGYRIAIDQWSEDHAGTISEIQMNIWEKGQHSWIMGSHIKNDPEQTLAELGDKIEWNDDADADADADADLDNYGIY